MIPAWAARLCRNSQLDKGLIDAPGPLQVYPAEPTGVLRTTRHLGPATTNESVAKLPEGKKVRSRRAREARDPSLSANRRVELLCSCRTVYVGALLNGLGFACLLCAQFFMAPSLTTGKGALKMGAAFGQYCHRTTGPAVATLELR